VRPDAAPLQANQIPTLAHAVVRGIASVRTTNVFFMNKDVRMDVIIAVTVVLATSIQIFHVHANGIC
jgi:hypothetical protein